MTIKMAQSTIFLKIFHGSVVILNSYTLWYDQMYMDLPFPSKEIEEMPLKARYIFLTVWCLVLQTLYFTVSLLNDIYGTDSAAPKKPPIIRKIKDVMFSVSFTVALYVSMIFWGIYTVQKDLIFPSEIERLFPKWVNHVMHTLIVPFILIELFMTRRNPPSRSFGFGVTLTLASLYTLWVHALYFKTGVWAYPFMEYFSWSMRGVFSVLSMFMAYAIYVLGEFMNSLASYSVKVYANGVNGDFKKIK